MPTPKLLSSTALRIKVGAGAIALLVTGNWLAPPRTATLAPSQERTAPLLEEQVQQREPAPPFRGVQDIADRIDVRGVAIYGRDDHPADLPHNDFEPHRPAAVDAFGVPLGSGFILTHRRALGGARQVRIALPSAPPAPAQLSAYDEATGLVLLRTESTPLPAAAVSTAMPPSGSLAVAAASWPGHELILPVFIALVSNEYLRIGGDGGTAAVGLPVYDSEGRLFAISLGRGEARPVRAAIDRLLQRAMAGTQPRSFGLAFQELTTDLESVFGAPGVLVVDTLPGGPATAAGIRPGDVITAVHGTEVSNPAELRAALLAVPGSSTATLAIRRAGKPIAFDLTAIDAYDAAALADRARSDEGILAAELLTPGQLAGSGIAGEARILNINGVEPSAAAARRELARRDVAVLVDDGARRHYVLVRAAS